MKFFENMQCLFLIPDEARTRRDITRRVVSSKRAIRREGYGEMKYKMRIIVILIVFTLACIGFLSYKVYYHYKYHPGRIPEATGVNQILLITKNQPYILKTLIAESSTRPDVVKTLGLPDNPESTNIWFYPRDVEGDKRKSAAYCLIFKNGKLKSPLLKVSEVTYEQSLKYGYGLNETEYNDAMKYVDEYVH